MPEILREHQAFSLYIGILVFGLPVLLPAIHLAAQGSLDPLVLAVVALAAMWTSDAAWYALGRCVPLERLRRQRLLARTVARADALFERFRGARTRLLFLSRFLYGSRIAVNLLCGLTRMRFRTVVLVQIASGVLWLGCLFLAVVGAAATFELFLGEAPSTALVLGVFLVLAVSLPAGVRVRAQRRARRRRAALANAPTVSVVIPAHDEQGHLEEAVRSVRRQAIAAEIVVVENGSSDQTRAIARRVADVVVERDAAQGFSRARNLGAAAASGALLVFLDADSRMGPGVLEAILARAPRGAVGTVLGRPDSWRLGYWILFKNLWHRLGLYRGALGGLLFSDAELFRRAGGFDETMEMDELRDFVRRARASGGRYALVTGAHAITSMRRFVGGGMMRSLWFWCCLRFGFSSDDRFAAWRAGYRAHRHLRLHGAMTDGSPAPRDAPRMGELPARSPAET